MKNDKSVSNGPFLMELPSNEHLLAIGKLVVTFNRFEENVVTIMSLCCGCEPELIANMAYGMDMNKRCQMLRGLLAYRLGSREKSDQGLNLSRDEDMRNIARLFKRVTSAIERRNLVVHSAWMIDEETGMAHMARPKGKQLTGFPGGNISPFTVKQINEHTEFINKVNDDLWNYFWEKLGPWIQQRALNGDTGIYSVQPTDADSQ